MRCPECGAELPAGSAPAVPESSPDLELATQPFRIADLQAGLSARIERSIVPGELLSARFRILGDLGRGGMGEVCRARDLKLEQEVALKFLPGAVCQDPDLLERLYREVSTARQVSHPNVCKVFDIGESEGRSFLSMEYIEGEDLGKLLSRRLRLPIPQAVSIARQVCAGLTAIHERRILHRDLKPSNVMVDCRGVVRITDFGLAEIMESVQEGLSREGTPLYMAPEQFAGGAVTPSSDIYALGLLLYVLFTGEHPFPGRDLEEMIHLRSRPPRPPSGLAPELDPAIDRMILQCLDPDPARRPASAKAVAAAFPSEDPRGPALLAAQRQADRIMAFREELADLRGAGVLDLDGKTLAGLERHHARVLRDLAESYDVDITERSRQLSLGMRLASLLGAMAFSASGFYFFYRLWGVIPFPLQLAILALGPLLAMAGAALAERRDPSRYFTSILATFAFVAFVLNLTVLSEIFNIAPSWGGYLAFGGFALLLAFAFSLRLLFLTGLLLLAVALSCALVMAAGFEWSAFLQRPESVLPSAALLLLLAAKVPLRGYPGFRPFARSLGWGLLIWPSLLIAGNGQLSFLPFRHAGIEVGYQLAGFGLGALAISFGIRRGQRDTLYVGSALFALLLLVAFSHWCWDLLPRYLFFLLIALGSVAAIRAMKILRAAANLQQTPEAK
jgi:hypothetical protein